MKVEIDGNEIRIKGKNVGDKRHIAIYVDEANGCDRYSFDIVKDGFQQSGQLPSVEMDDRHVIKTGLGGNKTFIE